MKPMASDFDAQDAAVCVVDKINYFKRNLAAQSYKKWDVHNNTGKPHGFT
jgi:hypothetical protein